MDCCSPVESRTSISRSGGSSQTSFAIPISLSVTPPMAETTTAIWCPSSMRDLIRLATLRMRSKDPTDVPPYFWTMSMSVRNTCVPHENRIRSETLDPAGLAAPAEESKLLFRNSTLPRQPTRAKPLGWHLSNAASKATPHYFARGTMGVSQPAISAGVVPDLRRPPPLPQVGLNGPTNATLASGAILSSNPAAQKQAFTRSRR